MMPGTRTEMGLDQLPGHSRLWIFQSSKVLEGENLNLIRNHLEGFLRDWAAHGRDLFAGFEIRFGRFIIIAVDEKVAAASGCSIDKMMRFVQAIDQEFDLALLDRMKVAYRSGEEIKEVHMNQFADMLKTGEADSNTIVFNNLTETLADLSSRWEVPVQESWHSNLNP